MKIQVLTDNPNSWMVPFVSGFVPELRAKGFDCLHILAHDQISQGDILVALSCEKILSKSHRSKNRYNLVVHESALPKGSGWSPLTWQILEGAAEIPVTLFEAADSVDSGVIYGSTTIALRGNELIDELRALQAEASFRLVEDFLAGLPDVEGVPQVGERTFYQRRRPDDSRLDPNKTIAEQFDQLRVVDNERYPAFFDLRGRRYKLKIEAWDDEEAKA